VSADAAPGKRADAPDSPRPASRGPGAARPAGSGRVPGVTEVLMNLSVERIEFGSRQAVLDAYLLRG